MQYDCGKVTHRTLTKEASRDGDRPHRYVFSQLMGPVLWLPDEDSNLEPTG